MSHSSSTKVVPPTFLVPRHIAMIMDGNGRWATKRFLPRVAGHVKGVEAVRTMVEACVSRGVEYLTLFAFSSENWRRPVEEVSFLMGTAIKNLISAFWRLPVGGSHNQSRIFEIDTPELFC